MKMDFKLKYGKFPNSPVSVNKIVWPVESGSWYLTSGMSFVCVAFFDNY